MNNNDALIRIRYILDLSDKKVREIFKLGGLEVTGDEVKKLLTKSKEDSYFHDGVSMEAINNMEDNMPCSNEMLERFLNGLIIFKRGKQSLKPGVQPPPELTIESDQSVNNVILKKLKIAFSLTDKDMLAIFESMKVSITKTELSALLRKEGHKHYRYCGDKYARKFLRGLTQSYKK